MGRSKNKGHFQTRDFRQVGGAEGMHDVSVRGLIEMQVGLVILRAFQLVSAEQGRKRLTHRARTSSAPLRQRCVPRCR